MEVQSFAILFDDDAQNPQSVYLPGQQVAFRLHLKLLQPVKCRAICVSIFGNSYVHWTESRTTGSGKSKRTVTEHYTSQEIYMEQNVAVFSPPTDGPMAGHHPAGEFSYAVVFQIPPSVPSSFEGGVGAIRYGVKANIDRPWRFDTTTQRLFTVIRDLDLNLLPATATGPFNASDDFAVNCCLCFNCCYGRVNATVSLTKTGFVPGEMVHVTGELHNTSSTDLRRGSLEINQRIVFHAEGRTKTTTRVTSSAELPAVPQGRSISLNQFLPVNPLPSTGLEGCTNIDVNYFLRLTAEGDGCCLSVSKDCCELTIGSVPLWAAASATSQMEIQPPEYSPPSYAECMFGKQAVTSDAGDTGTSQAGSRAAGFDNGQASLWAPSYPVFFNLPPVG